jgi:hypothetical protein
MRMRAEHHGDVAKASLSIIIRMFFVPSSKLHVAMPQFKLP